MIFDEMDDKNRGWITAADIEKRLIRFGLPNATTQANILLNALAKDDNKLQYTDFYKFVRRREEKLYEVYKTVDTNKDGMITPDELTRRLASQSEIFSDPSIAAKASRSLISRMDVTGDGSISFREFSRVFVVLPELDVEVVFQHWTKYAHIDMGEDYSLPDEPSVEKSRTNIFISGAIAGCVSRCVTAPMDRLKVIMQAGKGDATIVNMMRYMYNEGGLIGMWRGNGINCLKIGPESAAKFLFYGEFKHLVTSVTGGDEMTPSVVEKFVAGAAAGAAAQTLVYPLEITKTRLALSTTGEYSSVYDVIKTIVTDGGVRGLYRGMAPSLLGILPYAGIDLMVFNTLKERWMEDNRKSGCQNKTPDVLTLLLFGATSTTCGQIVAYPLQLIRTRLQADKHSPSGASKYSGMLDCFKKAYAAEGILGLYRGIGPNMLKSIPSISISYAVFETCSTYFHGMVI
eukprot:CAMPEP_0185032710 /NCGR_PEP_ID=MMETSP1103-20130426/21031_1 /TAXON_ID=36769 /ORGANISM="Paraphysomonas bandaiensis, Strain Caron Lab Isolate" /LENGTH=458 /DNA_ID=CAMNT_0027568699 /DNA_START=131 /DNA_END=1507 /DNA_ORIENTATION=+